MRSPRAPAWLALLAAALLGACGAQQPEPRAAPAARPNVVLIVIDTLRADHMSLYGYERRTTPAIEAWAAGGTVYERCWAPSSWTAPSTTALLGGAVRVGMTGFRHPEHVPLAEILQRAGYRTAAFVANPLLGVEQGYARGFDTYEVPDPVLAARKRFEGWSARDVVGKALDWLAQPDSRPFFAYLHLFDPHAPYAPLAGRAFEPWDRPEREQALRAALSEAARGLWSTQVYRSIEHYLACYDSEVLQADAQLAALFDRLAQSGLQQNTLVVLTADHGEGLWQRGMPPSGKRPKGAFFPELYSSHGEYVYSEQVHVPLVLRGPGFPAARRLAHEVSLVDVLPTILQRLDLPAPGELNGIALDAERAPERDALVAYCAYVASLTEQGRWRLHLPYEDQGKRAPIELFDLAADPLELHPLEDVPRRDAMRARLEQWLAEHAYTGPELPAGPVTQQLMRALGYAGHDEQR